MYVCFSVSSNFAVGGKDRNYINFDLWTTLEQRIQPYFDFGLRVFHRLCVVYVHWPFLVGKLFTCVFSTCNLLDIVRI